jgi:DNA-binding GntR family transcriptional regulator
MPNLSLNADNGLLKHSLAERLRKEILDGTLPLGTPIVEAKWAMKFGVAQASIREAINILGQAGFVVQSFRP